MAKPLPIGGGRVPDRIQLVGPVTDFRFHPRHLGQTARVIRNRPVCVDRKLYSRRSKHSEGGYGNTVESGGEKSAVGCQAENNNRKPGSLHSDLDTRNDIGCRARFGSPGDSENGLVLLGGIILGYQPYQYPAYEPGGYGQYNTQVRVARAAVGKNLRGEEQDNGHTDKENKYRRADGPDIQGSLGIAALLRSNKIGRYNRHYHSNSRYQKGKHDQFLRADSPSQDHGADNGSDIGFTQVRAETGYITHVIAHVIGDSRGVSRVILGNTRFDLADKVRTYIRRLRKDAAPDPGEQGDGTRSEGIPRQHGQYQAAEGYNVVTEESGIYQEKARKPDNPESDNRETHDAPAGKSDDQGPR